MSTLILAIDTATPAVTAGIVRLEGVEVLAERVTVDARAHAEQLTPNVIAALADAGLTVNDLGAVVVGCGPGPFTGLRVGMATAAAYGHALGIPVHGVCSLDAIGIESAATTAEVLVVTDARRREVYWARYRDGVRIDGPAVDAPADVPADAQAVAGSPEHAALFDLPRLTPAYPTAAGFGARRGRLDGRAGAVDSAVSAPSRRQTVGGDHPMTVVYDSLTRHDAARCAELEAQLFEGDDPWPARAFLAELEAKHIRYVAARADDKLVGYAGISRLGRNRPYEYEIHTIGVDPAYQGQGIGRRMMTELLEYASGGAVFLEVRTDNEAAISLYESLGFVNVGLRRRYYRASGADAYTMRRDPQ